MGHEKIIKTFGKGALLCVLALVVGIGCGRKEKSRKDSKTKDAVATPKPEVQGQGKEAQSLAQNQSIEIHWEEADAPTKDEVNKAIEVTSRFSLNKNVFEVTTTHSILGDSYPAAETKKWDLDIPGVTVTTEAGCSDLQCSQYAITYNVQKNGVDVIQHLVWLDFQSDAAPRIHWLKPGQTSSLNAWFNFASENQNFIDP